MAAGSVFCHATPDGHNYNLNLVAQSTNKLSSGTVGDVNIIAGSSLGDPGVPSPSAGNVVIRAGDYHPSADSGTHTNNLGTGAGSILLQPGAAHSSSDSSGAVVIFKGADSTPSSFLQAANPFGGDPTQPLSTNHLGIKGTLLFSTPMGVVETVMIDDTMDLAGVQAAINLANDGGPYEGLIASTSMGTHDTGGPDETIRVGMTSQGYGAQVLYLGDRLHQDAIDAGYVSGALNEALGDFRVSDGALEIQGGDGVAPFDGRRVSASTGLKTVEDGVLAITHEPFGSGLATLLTGGLRVGVQQINVGGDFVVAENTTYVGVDSFTPTAPIRIQIPNEDWPGKVYFVKDEGGAGAGLGTEITIVVTSDNGATFGLIDGGVAPITFGAGKLSYTLLCTGVVGGQSHWSLV